MAIATVDTEPRSATIGKPKPVSTPINVGETERLLSAISGGALAITGLARASLPGLGVALVGGGLIYRGLSGHCPVYQSLHLTSAKRRAAATSVPAAHGVIVEKTFTIQRSPEDLYNFWRNFENLPRIMSHLKSVSRDRDITHWVARAPFGMSVEWDAEIISERPNELIGWRSVDGGDVDNAGSVHFTPAPGNRGTEVRIVLKYDPPAGKLGALVAGLFGEEPEQQITEDLRHFKQIMEAGEIPTVEGQSSGRVASRKGCHS
jgi:uncharacterized membrane protein